MVIGAVFILAFVLPFTSALAKDEPGKIAAKVDNRTIDMQTFDQEVAKYMMQYKGAQGNLPPAFMQQIRTQAINTLINREVLLQESEKRGIQANKEEVQKGIKSVQDRFPSQEKFQEALKNLNLTQKDFEQQYMQQSKIQALLDQEIISKIKIKEDEAKAYFDANSAQFDQKETVRARHILMKVEKTADEKTKAEARKKLAEVQKKIMAGEDFAEMAKQHSQGPSNVKGGDLGYFGKGQMVKPFEEVAFKLAAGEVSDIVETRFGYHLIKVVDRKASKKAVYTDQKQKIMAKMKNERIQKEVNTFITKLRKEAKIENLIQ
ncbi:MAG: peptidylprolyl isomerase [Desulfobacteraceae bacterium]|jgi:peptidyl-prolyl cis-trans isomerase C